MQLFIHKDEGTNTKPLKDMARKRLPQGLVIHEEYIDFSKAPWEEYTRGLKGIARNWLYKRLEKLSSYFHDTLDFHFSLVLNKNWKEPRVRGWHLGATLRDARVCLVRNRRNYEDTAEHELVHAMWSYVRVHTGIRLEHKFGVSEAEAVHGTAPGYENYKYDWFWEGAKHEIQLAYGEDLADEYRGLLELTARKAQKVIRQLSS